MFQNDKMVSRVYDNFTDATDAAMRYVQFARTKDELRVIKAYNSPTGIAYWNVVDKSGTFVGKATSSVDDAYKQLEQIARVTAGLM